MLDLEYPTHGQNNKQLSTQHTESYALRNLCVAQVR